VENLLPEIKDLICFDPLIAKDIGRLDENSAGLGIPKGYLMECAGSGAATAIQKHYALNSSTPVLIVCGTGNNGGDGFVIARHLSSMAIPVYVLLVGSPTNIRTEEALVAWNLINNLPLNIHITIAHDSSLLKNPTVPIKNPTIILDCLLGTGVIGKIREPIASAIDFINSFKCPIVAIDVPSGMDPDTGKVLDRAVRVDLLVTFHRIKKGLTQIKDVVVVPIGIPLEAHLFVGEGDLKNIIPKRKSTNYKGEYGKLLVIGGSEDYSGAPSFAALAALELGIDLCIMLIPNSIVSVVRSYSPSLIVRPGTGCNLNNFDVPLAKELTGWADAVVVGPGIGTHSDTKEFLKNYLPWLATQSKPYVVDADGIKGLSSLIQSFQFHSLTPFVITPHVGEFQTLFGKLDLGESTEIELRSKILLEKTSTLPNAILLLKGKYDYITDGKSVRVNRTGCPEMAVGGTGDVLAGLVGAMLSLKITPYLAACSAAYLNGLLGENAQKAEGSRISAADLITQIHPTLEQRHL
jgi:NAD(P)H-hydrate epimerase